MEVRKSPPQLLIEKLHLGELDPHTSVNTQACQNELETLSSSNEQIWAEYPPDMVALQIAQRLRKRRLSIPGASLLERLNSLRSPKWQWAAIVLLVCAPVGLLVLNRPNETDRIKGLSPFLTIYRKVGNSFERMSSNSKVAEHDIIQISYVAHDARFGAIFSVDGNGKLTLHYPERPGPAAKLITSGEVILPDAFELDSSPQFERFVFVTSPDSFETQSLIEHFQQGSLPKQYMSSSVLLKK
ncbi:MAG: hypothetical protein HYR96_04485 [Deltaproteobacteria bacterium]|nr:hypothetical protein [Deltaproteobacteria bacterium]MBI3295023.1 hypothetical protein [Deltaproteobacteria bacterium]